MGFTGFMRSLVAFLSVLASLTIAAPALAANCPGNPQALGTSRTLVVDPTKNTLLGSFQYRETLPLNDKEVVITFDDGPLPPYTTRILDILARECVKATFFMVGRMASTFPKSVHRIYNDGHTLANHSQNHPTNFNALPADEAAREIEDGFSSIASAIGDPAKVAPFFRFPGLGRQNAAEHYLKSRQVMSWSVDFMADDWTRISAREVVNRALARLEAKGKGILLLHDIQPATALALPDLLGALKARGYRVVHVIPASATRPATATTAEAWRVRNPPSRAPLGDDEPIGWPRIAAHSPSPNANPNAAPPHGIRASLAVLEAPAGAEAGVTQLATLATPETAASDTPRNGNREIVGPTHVDLAGILPRNVSPVRRSGKADSISKNAKSARNAKDTKDTKDAKPSKPAKTGRTSKRDLPGLQAAVGHQIQIPRPQASIMSPR